MHGAQGVLRLAVRSVVKGLQLHEAVLERVEIGGGGQGGSDIGQGGPGGAFGDAGSLVLKRLGLAAD